MSGEGDSTGQQDPGTAQEQIEQQIAIDQAMSNPWVANPWVAAAYGAVRATPAAGGSGYQFDPAEVDTIIAKLQDVVLKARSVERQLRNAAAFVTPPAADPPSGRQATAAVEAVTRAIERNTALVTYATDFIQKLQGAKKAYAASEEHGAQAFEKQV